MAQIAWHRFEDGGEMARVAAEHVRATIAAAVQARGVATLALPGGKTPIPIFEQLAEMSGVEWSRVVIVPTDDRLVEADNALSNLRLLRAHFGETGARIVPMTAAGALDTADAATVAERALAGLGWPLDLLWLGVGGDGHTGSILPGPDFARALAADSHAAAVVPDPLPPEAPVPRVTLTLSAMTQARATMVTISGEAKRGLVEQAIADGAASSTAIGAVLAAMAAPVDLFWSA